MRNPAVPAAPALLDHPVRAVRGLVLDQAAALDLEAVRVAVADQVPDQDLVAGREVEADQGQAVVQGLVQGLEVGADREAVVVQVVAPVQAADPVRDLVADPVRDLEVPVLAAVVLAAVQVPEVPAQVHRRPVVTGR